MKLVVLHFSQLTDKIVTADKQSGVNLKLSSPAYLPPISSTSDERERLAAADASHFVGIGIYKHQPCLTVIPFYGIMNLVLHSNFDMFYLLIYF